MDKKEPEDAFKYHKYLKPLVRSVSTRISIAHTKSAKRVLAPYVNLMRRGRRVTLRRGRDKFNFFLSKRSSVLMKNLTVFMANSNELPLLLHETTDVLKSLTNSLGARLYIIDQSTNQLYLYQHNAPYKKCRVNYEIEAGKSLAAYVAKVKEYVMVADVTKDRRFPEGVTYKDNVKSVLCVPVMSNSDCFAVVELYRETDQDPYEKHDLKIVVLVCGWVGLAIQQNREGMVLHKQQEINDDLLQLVLAFYGNTVTFENVLAEMLNYAKTQLNAEKGAVYVIEKDRTDFFADVYDEGIMAGKNSLIKKKLRVKFGKEKTVASWVANHCELLNVRDVYNDPRFTKEISKDDDQMVINRTELCMPMMGRHGIMGIITLINKKNGFYFTQTDEHLMQTIATYCSLALHYQRSLEANEYSKLRIEQNDDLIAHHLKPCPHSLMEMENDEFSLPRNFKDFNWYIMNDDIEMMPKLCVHMFRDLFGDEIINRSELDKFIITLRNSYRDIPYHNFEHAFNVSHCIYSILNRNKESFSLIELQALMVAATVHDVDHKGFTNSYLCNTKHYLARLYQDAPWENHHFYVANKILSLYNIFNNMEDRHKRKTYMELIERAVLDTDLVNYFKSRSKMIPLLANEEFDLKVAEHMQLLKAIIMTVSDLSVMCKPFSVQLRVSSCLYKEFYNQGDIEKSLGLLPLSMMDRDKQSNVPDDQMNFITIVVMPAMTLLKKVFPNTEALFTNAELLRDTWRKIIDSRGEKLWRQCDSVVS